MKREHWILTLLPVFLVLFVNIMTTPIFAEQTNPQDRIASFKAFLKTNKKSICKYEWIETTTLYLKGEEKSKEQMRCYYGADGKIQKVPLTEHETETKKRRGPIRKRLNKRAEDKKRKMKEYIEEIVSLTKQYFPPNPVKIQAAKKAGNISFQPIKPENTIRLKINDYLKSGDSLSFEINPKNSHPAKANMASYLDSNKDPVKMAVTFGTLNDGTSYVSKTVMDADKKELKIVIENSGYRKTTK